MLARVPRAPMAGEASLLLALRVELSSHAPESGIEYTAWQMPDIHRLCASRSQTPRSLTHTPRSQALGQSCTGDLACPGARHRVHIVAAHGTVRVAEEAPLYARLPLAPMFAEA